MSRRSHSTSQSSNITIGINKVSAAATEGTNSIKSSYVAREGSGSSNIQVSGGFNVPIGSQPLAPIGKPVKKTEELRTQKLK